MRYLMEKDYSAKGESVCFANSAIELRMEGTHSWLCEWVETGAGCVSSAGHAREVLPPQKITLRLSGFRLGSFLLVVHLFHDKNFRNDLANTYIFSSHGISDNIQESVLSWELLLCTQSYFRTTVWPFYFFTQSQNCLAIEILELAAMILFERSAEGRTLFCTGRLANKSSYAGKVEVLDFSHEIHTSD